MSSGPPSWVLAPPPAPLPHPLPRCFFQTINTRAILHIDIVCKQEPNSILIWKMRLWILANNLQTGTDFSVNRHLKAEHAQKKPCHGDELDTTAVGPLRRGGGGGSPQPRRRCEKKLSNPYVNIKHCAVCAKVFPQLCKRRKSGGETARSAEPCRRFFKCARLDTTRDGLQMDACAREEKHKQKQTIFKSVYSNAAMIYAACSRPKRCRRRLEEAA